LATRSPAAGKAPPDLTIDEPLQVFRIPRALRARPPGYSELEEVST
jgi:hypothetical protein